MCYYTSHEDSWSWLVKGHRLIIMLYSLWLSEIGLKDYKIDEKKIILGENEKSYWVNMVLLITKKVIFNAKIAGKIPSLFSVKYNLQTIYNNELLKSRLIQKEYIFERRWGIMMDYIEEQ